MPNEIAKKPYSAACDRNRGPILEQLQRLIICHEDRPAQLLEIGSGTGQHAVYLAKQLGPDKVEWQPSDVAENLEGIRLWQKEAAAINSLPVVELDLSRDQWLAGRSEFYDYVYTANTLHIVSWPLVEALLKGSAFVLKPGGKLFIYGPFNYNGEYSSDSNREFDKWLKLRDPQSAIRDIEAVITIAKEQMQPLEIVEDLAMPANNRLLVFEKR